MSSSSTPGTFQVSTDQFIVTSTLDLKPASEPSRTVQVGSEQVRIDTARAQARPHFRALQLDEFTTWLKSHQSPSSSEAPRTQSTDRPFDAPPKKSSGEVNSRTTVRYRVDAGNPANASAARSPHFETANYVAPDKAVQGVPETTTTTKGSQVIPTDGFDPNAGVHETIRQLKADGRILADLHQTDLDVPPQSNVTHFHWSQVTEQLLGGPAILNLEMNVARMTSLTRNRVLVASAGSGTGATTVAMTLARQLEVHGKKVLLVDANLVNPTMAIRLTAPQHLSWVQAISQRRSIDDVIVKQPNSNLCLLPLTPIAAPVSWSRKIYDQLAIMLDSWTEQFDAVIIDVGTIDQWISESSNLGQLADATLLVSGQDMASDIESDRAQSRLVSFGVEDMLIVRNFAPAQSSGHAKVG